MNDEDFLSSFRFMFATVVSFSFDSCSTFCTRIFTFNIHMLTFFAWFFFFFSGRRFLFSSSFFNWFSVLNFLITRPSIVFCIGCNFDRSILNFIFLLDIFVIPYLSFYWFFNHLFNYFFLRWSFLNNRNRFIIFVVNIVVNLFFAFQNFKC
uniref:Uncharacterized protein n=1 Tax=Iridovirus sp. TaxID=135728 RepID=A0AAU7YE97_9VIRU